MIGLNTNIWGCNYCGSTSINNGNSKLSIIWTRRINPLSTTYLYWINTCFKLIKCVYTKSIRCSKDIIKQWYIWWTISYKTSINWLLDWIGECSTNSAAFCRNKIHNCYWLSCISYVICWVCHSRRSYCQR